MHEEYMQRKAEQDAEGYVTSHKEEVSDAKSRFSDLRESDTLPEYSLCSEKLPLLVGWSDSKESLDSMERRALSILEYVRKMRAYEKKKLEKKKKAELEKEQKKKAKLKEQKMKRKVKLKKIE
jgi:hypothetical protein